MIHLTDIDENNWRLPLSVRDEQKAFVASSAVLLARAYAYRNLNSRAFYIYDDDTAVGMGLYYDCPEMDAYDLRQFFIDARYQGKGYGKEAVRLCLEEMRLLGRFDKVVLCYVEGDEAARRLYESFGFVQGDRDGDEITMEMKL